MKWHRGEAERRSTGVPLRGQRALPDQGVERSPGDQFVCDLSGAPHRSGWLIASCASVLRLRGVSTGLLRQEGIAVCRSDDAAGL